MEQMILSSIQTLNYVGVILLTAVQQILAFIPSETIIATAGKLLCTDTTKLIITTLCAVIGTTIGSVLMYWIGYFIVKPILIQLRKCFFIKDEELEKADANIKEYGFLAIIVAKGIPIISNLASIPMGVTRANFKKFTLVSFIGSIPWSLTFTFAGYYLNERWNVLGTYVYGLKLGAMILIDILTITFIYKKLTKPTIEITSSVMQSGAKKENN